MSVREVAVEAYREAVPALGASLLGGLLAGVVLGGMRAELEAVPGLLVLVPALLATRGNVYGSLGARIATALHQGLVEPRVTGADRRLYAAVAAALGNGILASLFAAAAAFLLLTLLGWTVAPLPTLLGIALVAGVLSGTVLTVVVVTVVFAGYRRGYNPDTLVGPVVTTTGDVFGILFLLVAVRAVLFVGGVA
ncbi:mgtE-like transporter [Halogranum amylolyticum]|uniref:MgtE-like transporter n=1 Tax=Halogranum amylolyticum TaxID=660520 RepID=A0A1H8QUW0_9EURY|nr:magnesium transporter [Halogranum amylolyticum]SEO57837.1 mgtE-like transporter [Halogranum amylolyticum]